MAAALPSFQVARQQSRLPAFSGLIVNPTRSTRPRHVDCQARPPIEEQRHLELAFKVRPVVGSTARHETLDADAMLHHHAGRQTTSLPKSPVNFVHQNALRCVHELLAPGRTRAQHSTAMRSRVRAAVVLAIVIPLILLSTTGVLEESNGGACDDISLPMLSYKVTPAVLIIHLKRHSYFRLTRLPFFGVHFIATNATVVDPSLHESPPSLTPTKVLRTMACVPANSQGQPECAPKTPCLPWDTAPRHLG